MYVYEGNFRMYCKNVKTIIHKISQKSSYCVTVVLCLGATISTIGHAIFF